MPYTPVYVIQSDKPPHEIVDLILKEVEKISHPNQSPDIWHAFRRNLFSDIYGGFRAKSDGRRDQLGNSWKRLSNRRIEAKAQIKQPSGRFFNPRWILRESDRLIKSIAGISSRSPDNPDSIIKLHANSLELGTQVPYAAVHHDGGMAYRDGHLIECPSRPLWPDTLGKWFDSATDKLTERIANKIAGAVSKKTEYVTDLFYDELITNEI